MYNRRSCVHGARAHAVINECASPTTNDCDRSAHCIDTRDSYACMCPSGTVDTSSQAHMPPGRRCANSTNECASPTLNTCDNNADCIDTLDSYECVCIRGHVDVSSSAHLPPGRVCVVGRSQCAPIILTLTRTHRHNMSKTSHRPNVPRRRQRFNRHVQFP